MTEGERNHQRHAIDVEELIAFSLWLGHHESAADVRAAALRGRRALDRLIADRRLARACDRHGVDAPAGPSVQPPVMLELHVPSLILLRLRAAFGVTSRSEVLRAFLWRPAAQLTIRALVSESCFARRTIVHTTDMLVRATVLDRVGPRNFPRFILARAGQVLLLAGNPPTFFPSWGKIFDVIRDLIVLSSRIDLPAAHWAAERFLDHHRLTLSSLGIEGPSRLWMERRETAWTRTCAWALSLGAAWAVDAESAFNAQLARQPAPWQRFR